MNYTSTSPCGHEACLTYKTRSSFYRRDSVRRSVRCSVWFNVIDFGTTRKPVYDFLLVNTNVHPSRTVSKLLQIIDQIRAFDRGVSLFNSLIRVSPKLTTAKSGNNN